MICMPLHQRTAPAVAATAAAGRRMLVTVTVLGSAGPIRFVTSEGEAVDAVVGAALRCYAREGRLPALGFDVGEFNLFCAHSDNMDPLDRSEPIGARGCRSFVLCKKKTLQQPTSSTAVCTVAAPRQERRNEGDGGGVDVPKASSRRPSHVRMASSSHRLPCWPLSPGFFTSHP